MDELVAAAQPDLREYLQVLRRRRLVIGSTVVVVVALALAYSLLAKPIYTASATVLLPEQQISSALNPQDAQLPASASLQRALADEQEFAQGQATKQAATNTLGYQATIAVSASSTADVLTFTAHSGDKKQAAAIANAYANAYISADRANEVQTYTQQVTALQTSITKLQAQANGLSAANPQKAALQDSVTSLTQTLQQLQAGSQLVTQAGPSVVDAATPPSSPSSPKPVRNGLLGLVLGVLLGTGMAFLVERLDDGIKSRQDAESAGRGLPVLGLIPMVDSWKARGSAHLALVEDPNSNASEAYRTLRTSIQFLSIDEPKHVLGITSATPEEGKTTTVANLAVSFARAGSRVIVVSCDLRRPRLHNFFGVDNAEGFSSVLLGQTSLNAAVQAVPDESRLRVMSSGPIPPNPAEVLSLDRAREVIDTLAENSDIVLIDCPPVLPVTDTLLLSRLVDGMLVVASAKTTSKRDLHRTVELLHQVGTPVLGLILNRVPQGGGYAYGYGYGYGYYGRYDLDNATDATPVNARPEPEEPLTPFLSARSQIRTHQSRPTQPATDWASEPPVPPTSVGDAPANGSGSDISSPHQAGDPATARTTESRSDVVSSLNHAIYNEHGEGNGTLPKGPAPSLPPGVPLDEPL